MKKKSKFDFFSVFGILLFLFRNPSGFLMLLHVSTYFAYFAAFEYFLIKINVFQFRFSRQGTSSTRPVFFNLFLFRGTLISQLYNNLAAPLASFFQYIDVKFINWRHPQSFFQGNQGCCDTPVENHCFRHSFF